ncbi:MAG: lamin tail domain-containing protein [Myxococcales bacterium]|nr:lamin tail domain-containing protein [Myxococcales bacterium]
MNDKCNHAEMLLTFRRSLILIVAAFCACSDSSGSAGAVDSAGDPGADVGGPGGLTPLDGNGGFGGEDGTGRVPNDTAVGGDTAVDAGVDDGGGNGDVALGFDVVDITLDDTTVLDTSVPPDSGSEVGPSDSGGNPGPDVQADTTGTTIVGSSGWCSLYIPDPWSRKIDNAGGTVTFNEILYHPVLDDGVEWVELYNPMTIDMDLSFWRLEGGISFVFPDGTLLPGGSYLVVSSAPEQMEKPLLALPALGPFDGKLSNGGEKLELWNNNGRLMDQVDYGDDEPWSPLADGSGATLAKREPVSASEPAENWTHSGGVGGTPGAPNFEKPTNNSWFEPAITLDSDWSYYATGGLPAPNWADPLFDDQNWKVGKPIFWSGEAPMTQGEAAALFTADNFFALYTGDKSGENLKWIGRDSVGDWTSAESFVVPLQAKAHLYVAAWEAPGSDGGPQMLIGQVQLPDGSILPTDAASFEAVLGPPNGSPGGSLSDPSPAVSLLADWIKNANTQQSWITPKAQVNKNAAPWGGALGGVFLDSVHYIWPDTFDALSATNQQNTFGLFRSKNPMLPSPGETELPSGPTTIYFRTHFELQTNVAEVQLWLDTILDDGAIVWLNGVEVYRQNMPQGAVTAETPASVSVGESTVTDGINLPTAALVSGDNVLAVELHDAVDGEADRAFGIELFVMKTSDSIATAGSPVQLQEVSAGSISPFWLDIQNIGVVPENLNQWVLFTSEGFTYVFPDTVLQPGEIRLLDETELGFGVSPGEMVYLLGADGQTVVDGVRVGTTPRARLAKGEAHAEFPWVFPDTTTPGQPNVAPPIPHVVLNEIHYHAAPTATETGELVESEEEWIELYNAGLAPVDLTGWTLNDGVEFVFPMGTTLFPGAYLVVADDAVAFGAKFPGVPIVGNWDGGLDNGGERIELRDACGNVVDEVAYQDSGRWPSQADGTGATLELKDPHADNNSAEAWGASVTKSEWVNVMYEGVVQASSVGPDNVWKEFVMGLLDSGVVLIDNLSVVEDPLGAKTELIQNGNFNGGNTDGWRIVGNHRHSQVVADPDNPQNQVLRLVATGSTEHMHNHAETTFVGNKSISNGKTVRVSFSARWESGSNQLHTRIYFNRLAKTTLLPRPTLSGTPGAKNSIAVDNIGPTYHSLRHVAAVPQPMEPVMVTVTAADPDGVKQLTLWTAVGGGPFMAVPMTPQGKDGVYAATVSGQPASTLVQFYIEGVDTLGAMSWFPAKGPASRAMWKVEDGLKATNGLHNVRIVMTKADSDWMHMPVNLMSNDPIECTVIVDEETIHYGVTARTKGSQRGRPEVKRLGYALRFPKDNRFRGIYRSVFIDRSEGVGYGQREMLMNQVMNRAGSVSGEYNDLARVITPRLEHTGAAELQLSRFSDQLLDFQFAGGGDGLLYEYELIYFPLTTQTGTPEGLKLPQPDNVMGVPIVGLGTGFGEEKERYRHTFTLKNNRDRDDYNTIMQFAKIFGQSGWAFQEQIETVIDLDQWLRTFAFTKLSGCVDNYGSDGAQHNAQFYVRPEDNKVLFFPHDMDFYPGSPTSAVVGGGDINKLLWSQSNKPTYYGHLYDIIQSAYNDSYMAYWRDHFGKLLPGQNFSAHHQFLVARSNHVLNGASDSILKTYPKVEFAVTTNGGADLVVFADWVTVEGSGWIDVREVTLVGSNVPLLLNWWNNTAWQTDVVLSCGLNNLVFEARNHKGVIVGQDTFNVIRQGTGCP